VPGTVEDCCRRIRDGTDLRAREDAREFLTFCRALGLAGETAAGYFRPCEPPDEAAVAEAFGDRIYAASEIIAALDEPRTGTDLHAEVVRPLVSRWERDRDPDWEETWCERTDRVLGWGVELGPIDRTEDDRFVRRT